MRKIILLLLLPLTLFVNARQIYTVRSGDWETDSVWYNNLKPNTIDDTISIYHHIMLHSNILLSTNDYLFIDSSGWLCGNDTLLMLSGSYLFNQGFLGLYYFELYNGKGLNLAPGIIDLGNGGMYAHGAGFHFLDSLGCMVVHFGIQKCEYPCINDTTLSININYNDVTFQTVQHDGTYYEYDFGDGNSHNTSDTHVSHTYSNAGEFWIQLIIYSCCGTDTVRRMVHIDMPPPPCTDSRSFIIYPDPTDEGFWIQKEFCADENIIVKIYSVTGQLIDKYYFSTSLKMLKEFIPCESLSSGCYIVDMQSSSIEVKQRVVVVHQ